MSTTPSIFILEATSDPNTLYLFVNPTIIAVIGEDRATGQVTFTATHPGDVQVWSQPRGMVSERSEVADAVMDLQRQIFSLTSGKAPQGGNMTAMIDWVHSLVV